MIEQFYPPPPKPPRVPFRQCDEETTATTMYLSQWRKDHYSERGLDPARCVRKAQYAIDGKHYCATHAARIALKRWVSGQLTEVKDKRNRDE